MNSVGNPNRFPALLYPKVNDPWILFKNQIQKESMMNAPNKNHPSAEKKAEQGYTIKIGHEYIRVISVFTGTKSASEAIYDAAIKKILYDCKENWRHIPDYRIALEKDSPVIVWDFHSLLVMVQMYLYDILTIKKKRASRNKMYGENPFLIINNKPFLLPCQVPVLIFSKFFQKNEWIRVRQSYYR